MFLEQIKRSNAAIFNVTYRTTLCIQNFLQLLEKYSQSLTKPNVFIFGYIRSSFSFPTEVCKTMKSERNWLARWERETGRQRKYLKLCQMKSIEPFKSSSRQCTKTMQISRGNNQISSHRGEAGSILVAVWSDEVHMLNLDGRVDDIWQILLTYFCNFLHSISFSWQSHSAIDPSKQNIIDFVGLSHLLLF